MTNLRDTLKSLRSLNDNPDERERDRRLKRTDKVVKFRDLAIGDIFGIVDRNVVLAGENTKVGARSHKDWAGKKWGIDLNQTVIQYEN